MRRTYRGSCFRLAGRRHRTVASALLSAVMLLCAPGLSPAPAAADPGAETLAALIAEVAQANQQLQDLRAAIETQQESVNKALVDVQTARDNAAAAQHDVEVSQQGVRDANAAIAAAQQRFDTFAAAAYVNGPSAGYLTAANPNDLISTAGASRALAASSEQVMANLQRSRTEQVNKESAARLAKRKADRAAADALVQPGHRGGDARRRQTQIRRAAGRRRSTGGATQCGAGQARGDA